MRRLHLSRSRAAPWFLSLVLATALVACGGGSGGNGTPPLSDGQGDENPDTQPDALPNFVISDITVPSAYTREEEMPVLVRVANIGEGAATVPDGWLQVSDTEDFSSGYAIYPFSLAIRNGGGSRVLEPGAERDFFTAIEIPLSRNGTHYTRVWLNPDLSAYFMNPEDAVVPSHEHTESNYEDNFSELRLFEAFDALSADCEADLLEENDSIESAAPIALDTSYQVNDCNEQLDVFAVELVEDIVYQLELENPNPLRATSISNWHHAVVDPDGVYLERPGSGSPLLIRARQSGVHHLVLRHIVYGSGGETVNFSLNSAF